MSKFSWSLSFRDKTIEKDYQESKFSYFKSFYKIFAFCASIFLLVGHFTDPFNSGFLRPLRILNTSGSLMFVLIPLPIFKKFPKRVEVSLIVSLQLIAIAFMEATYLNKEKWNTFSYFIMGNIFITIFLSPLISKISWKYTLIFSIITSSYCQIRYMKLYETSVINYQPLVMIIWFSVFVPIISFIMEKYDRQVFSEKTDYENSLKCFKDLIKDVLPSSILICRNKKVVYANNEANRFFNTNNNDELLELCKNIWVQKKHPSRKPQPGLIKSEKKLSLPSQTSLLFGEDNISKSNQKTMRNLYDIISETANHNESEKIFRVYCGKFDHEVNNQDPPQTSSFYVEIKMNSIFWEGNEARILLINEDTLLHKLQLLKERNQYKDQLLATVSHDLRTPLNGMIGMISQLLEELLPPSIKKSLNIVFKSAHHLLYMINDILDYSQINNGKLRINLDKVEILSLIKDAAKLIKFQVKMKGLKFIIENNLPPHEKKSFSLKSDVGRLKQIVLNLLGNALKFTEEGHIKVVINKKINAANIPYIEIRVEDTGCGIEKDDIPKLFQLFGKLHTKDSVRINKSGVGLGLAISQGLLFILNKNQQGGTITVESEIGKGSTFLFGIFTNEEVEEESETNEQMQVGIIPSSNIFLKSQFLFQNKKLFKPNILVVDDDQINLLVASEYLVSIGGIDFTFASNGKDAIIKIEENQKKNKYFDLILMDCNMPLMDGFEATKIVLKKVQDGEIPALSIVACTANASEEDYDKCFKTGMIAILTKPFMKKDLKETIDKALLKK